MYLTKDVKTNFFGKYGKSEFDTGNSEAQIALFTYRINHLTEHLKENKKDFQTQKALIGLVGQRRKLLDYLKKIDIQRYRAIIGQLNIRK
jgi:small subunit ribosomal protein S15